MIDYQEMIKTLRDFNLWRRGDDSLEQPEPREIGKAIDAAIGVIEQTQTLINAAKAVITRWDTPLWKDVEHTGVSIAALRKAVEGMEQPPAVHITGELDQQGS